MNKLKHLFTLLVVSLCAVQGVHADGNIVTVKPTDNLTELISAATDGQEFRLEAGTYAVNGSLDVSKSISIVAADEENKPVIQAYFNLLSGASLTLCNVVLDGSGLNTYTQAFLLKAENSTYDKLLVEGCEIKYFSKGVIYGGNVSGLAKEITFNNCLIHDIECNGGELFDFRKTAFNTLTLSNSTIWNSCQKRDIFRLDDSSENVTADAKLIVNHNTFYNVGNSGQYSRSFFYVRYPNNSITFTNNIVDDAHEQVIEPPEISADGQRMIKIKNGYGKLPEFCTPALNNDVWKTTDPLTITFKVSGLPTDKIEGYADEVIEKVYGNGTIDGAADESSVEEASSSVEESKADESVTESKADSSKADTASADSSSSSDKEESSNTGLIIGIVCAAVVVIAVVAVVIKKKS